MTALIDTPTGTAVGSAPTTTSTTRRPSAWRLSGAVAGVALFAFPS